ncbi:MAG: DNA polymerase III subunit chi [Parachlamydiales bacterium]|jgi:DNA polymerase-3 subunit chi
MIQNKVIFYKVQSVKDKLIKIIQTAMAHFEKKEKFIIQVQDDVSVKFVDELLWKLPKESFLPHIATDSNSSEYIVITKSKKNLNDAIYMFNLSQDIFEIDRSFKVIYDFDDYTAKDKQIFSQKRFEIYRKANFIIESK